MMMNGRVLLSIITCFGLTACYGVFPWERTVPDEAVIDGIERELSGHACIGDVDQWERIYFFARDHDSIREAADTNKIWIRFKQAGVHEFRAGRRIVTFDEGAGGIDDRQYRMVSGDYDVSSGRISIEHCGWNHGENIEITES